MQIESVSSLEIFDVKLVRFKHSEDERGYFAETFNINDVRRVCPFMNEYVFEQHKEAYSYCGTLRGLHIQTNPALGKFVRVLSGSIIDFALDLRTDSETFRHIVGVKLAANNAYGEWIWVPTGFGHGTLALEDAKVEYYCTDAWNPQTEHSVSIFSNEINWSLCDKEIVNIFTHLDRRTLKIKSIDLKNDRCII